jgi:hypothetical protein
MIILLMYQLVPYFMAVRICGAKRPESCCIEKPVAGEQIFTMLETVSRERICIMCHNVGQVRFAKLVHCIQFGPAKCRAGKEEGHIY